ncbi:MAG: hypothetical protein J6T10_07740 [Methanobrevibacter sp.]|nr:hypothetical protein [Methanobrevibacter sp.]
MIRDYEIKYSENGIQIAEDDFERPITKAIKEDLFTKHYKMCQHYMLFASIVKKYMKVKGDMLVMENVSRKKNKKDFEEMEKFLNEYQR